MTSGFFALTALSPISVTTPVWVSRTSAQRFPAVNQGSLTVPTVAEQLSVTTNGSPNEAVEPGPLDPRWGPLTLVGLHAVSKGAG